MTKNFLFIVSILLVPSLSKAADDPANLLETFVGHWQGEFSVDSEPEKTAFETTSQSMLGGNCVLSRITSKDDGKENLMVIMWNYHPETKTYHRWLFFPDGSYIREDGQWDEGKKTFRFDGYNTDTRTGTSSTVKILDKNTKQWTMKIESADGEVYEVQGITKRKK